MKIDYAKEDGGENGQDKAARMEALILALASVPRARDAALANAAESGAVATDADGLEAAIDEQLNEAVTDAQSATLDYYIEQARELLGLALPTLEEEISKLAPGDEPET